MTTKLYSQQELEDLARSAGFSAEDSRIAAAIALCESPTLRDGKVYANPTLIGDVAIQDDVFGPSIGLFQIRSLKADFGTGKTRDAEYLMNPLFNARAAYSVFKEQGFEAWTRYRDGSYEAYLQDLFPPDPGTYTVVYGDTYYGIAKRLGFSATKLQQVNHWIPLDIGTVLELPYVLYTVRVGDTLSKIAYEHGLGSDYKKIAEFNGITNPNVIRVGQELRIPR